jgi:hypothetical protein
MTGLAGWRALMHPRGWLGWKCQQGGSITAFFLPHKKHD